VQAMYRNFYRDPWSAGLVAVPYGMVNTYFGQAIPKVHRSYYLCDVLHRLDHWKAETEGRFPVRTLATADIGNPFGAMVEGIRVEAGAPYRHYCADKVSGLLDSATPTVAEIGGGFGGMAYYLLRDRPDVHYFDFDEPESLALATYYLMKAFPQLSFELYGEDRNKSCADRKPDVTLLPLFELSRIPSQTVDVVFSSHALSDIPRDALPEYLTQITRVTRGYLLNIGVRGRKESIPDLMTANEDRLSLVERRRSGWNTNKPSGLEDIEQLYSVRGVDDIARGHHG
jgi:putative sugar O-methyltransferase